VDWTVFDDSSIFCAEKAIATKVSSWNWEILLPHPVDWTVFDDSSIVDCAEKAIATKVSSWNWEILLLD
jgi:hypothetical protein